MSRRRRVLVWTTVGTVVLLATAAAALGLTQPWRSAQAETKDDPKQTEKVERTTLTSDLVLNANLTYGDAIELSGRGGTITRLPKAGDVIAVGQALYEVDGAPVIAVRGDRPFWRALSEGVPDGADVAQLEQFLVDSGFGANLTVDNHFTSVTEKAVQAWQKSLGLEKTGVVDLGAIVAVNAAAVRVAAIAAKLGDNADASPLTYTSTKLHVAANLTDAQARELLPATGLTVTLPDGTEAPGSITSIDPGGQPGEKEGETTPPRALIDLDDPAAADGVGLRSVKVKIPSETAADTLVIPVVALVSTLDGGYAVDVLRKGEIVRVPVTIGLVADTRAQVVSGDIKEGDTVVVAK